MNKLSVSAFKLLRLNHNDLYHTTLGCISDCIFILPCFSVFVNPRNRKTAVPAFKNPRQFLQKNFFLQRGSCKKHVSPYLRHRAAVFAANAGFFRGAVQRAAGAAQKLYDSHKLVRKFVCFHGASGGGPAEKMWQQCSAAGAFLMFSNTESLFRR